MEINLNESIYTNQKLVKPIARKASPKYTESVFFILSSTKSDLGNLIQKVLDVDYNHISFSFEDNFNQVYAFGTDGETNRMGFIIERFDKGYYKENDGEYLTLEMKVSPMELKKLKKNIKIYEEGRDKYKFNKAGLFINALGVPYNPGDAFFCSQFIAKLFEDSGIKLFDKNYGLVRPSDFLFHPSLKQKHKGLIKKRLKYEEKNHIRKQAMFLK